MPNTGILCLGNAVVDLIARPVDALPEPGQLHLVESIEMHVGGNGPNCALAIGRLGGRALLAGRVGDDLPGRFLRDRLDSAGVDTRQLGIDADQPTSLSVVVVNSSGERSFLHLLGANATFTAGHVDLDGVEKTGYLHAGSHFILPSMDGEPLRDLLAAARARGIRTSLDVCWDPSNSWMNRLAPCLPVADLFMPNEAEAEMLSGESQPEKMAARFQSLGANDVIIKCGSRGCYARAAEWTGWMPAPEVECVDSTGAGDCFAAGLLVALARGEGFRSALRFATGCGALSVTGVGAAAALVPWHAVVHWLNRTTDLASGSGGTH